MQYIMLFVYLALYLFAVYHYGLAVNTTVNESKCKELFTHGYGYHQFMHVPSGSGRGGGLSLKFWVKARSNAHILLSPSPSPEETDPGYEVVLGAGKNTFSDIRRMRRTSTKSSAYTKDILSGTELKGFWVKINNEGLLMVGNEGDDLPLLEWQDPDPLHIEYFSFSTWSGVAGKWLYECATDNREKEESAVVKPVLTPVERLRKALLTNYNVYVPPVSDLSQPLDIKVGVQVDRVQLDSKKAVMTTGFVFNLEWYDDVMVWNSNDFNNISTIYLIHHEIWQPQLVHFNAAGKGFSIQGKEGVRVTDDGKVSWKIQSMLNARCQLNLQHWPWDIQSCNIQFGLWNQHYNLHLLLMENRTELKLQKVSSEWMVKQLSTSPVTVKRLWLDSMADSSDDDTNVNDSYSALEFTFSLHRVNSGFNYIYCIPLLVIMVMSLCCFWMEPLSSEKPAMNCLVLLLLSGFLCSLSSGLTTPSDTTPLLLRAYTQVLVFVSCSAIASIITTRLAGRSQQESIPQIIWTVLSSNLTSKLFCLPFYTENSKDFIQVNDETGTNCQEDNRLLEFPKEHDVSWTIAAILCDRIAFITALALYLVVIFSLYNTN